MPTEHWLLGTLFAIPYPRRPVGIHASGRASGDPPPDGDRSLGDQRELSGLRVTTTSSATSASIPIAFQHASACAGVSTIGSPGPLNEVFSTTPAPTSERSRSSSARYRLG